MTSSSFPGLGHIVLIRILCASYHTHIIQSAALTEVKRMVMMLTKAKRSLSCDNNCSHSSSHLYTQLFAVICGMSTFVVAIILKNLGVYV